MSRLSLSLLVFFASTASTKAADDSFRTPAPQVRPKLDPATRTAAIVRPAPAANQTEPAKAPTLMERYVVKEESLLYLLKRPRTLEDPQGKFTLKNGGRIYRKDRGPFRVEVGMWPHISISPEEDAFTGRGNQAFDFVRIKW
ncbi:MAG: hypothetical protein JWM88_2165 [Verrucomicrobia bacterium]|nr:hypothetical protein [Verrucomicrobiota bacterium]